MIVSCLDVGKKIEDGGASIAHNDGRIVPVPISPVPLEEFHHGFLLIIGWVEKRSRPMAPRNVAIHKIARWLG
jgi:hypothetical protein